MLEDDDGRWRMSSGILEGFVGIKIWNVGITEWRKKEDNADKDHREKR
jgi:hypothetical protein